MAKRRRRLVSACSKDLTWLVSPLLVAPLMAGLGLTSTLLPVRWYMQVMREPDLMFGHTELWLFVLACLGAFLLLFFVFVSAAGRRVHGGPVQGHRQRLGWPLARGFLLLAVPLYTLLFAALQLRIGFADILGGISGGAASELRLDIDDAISQAKLNWVSPFVAATLLCAFWFLPARQERRPGDISLFAAVALLHGVGLLITLTRGNFFEMLLSVLVLWIAKRSRQRRISLRRLLRGLVLTGGVLAALFFAVDALRNTSYLDRRTQAERNAETIVGYFPASYNRLAALLDGHLVLPNSGATYYTLQGLWDMPVVSSTLYKLGREAGLDLPSDTRTNWRQQFKAVGNSGLRHQYIWATAFGFAYADWGWLSVLWFGVMGGLTGLAYAALQRGQVFGVVMYPLFLFSILQWWSIAAFLQRKTVIYLAFCLVFSAVLNLLESRRPMGRHAGRVPSLPERGM